VTVGWRIVLFTIVLSLVAAIAFGLVPAMQSSRPQATALRGRSGTPGERHLGHSLLVVGELALCLTLLVAASLLLRSFLRLHQVDTGATAPETNVLTMQVSPKPIVTKDPNAAAAASISFYLSIPARRRAE